MEPREFAYSGSARIFSWHEVQETDRFACPCGWRGALEELVIAGFRELVDGSCPRCDRMLMIRNFPTIAEVRKAAAHGDQRASAEFATTERTDAPISADPV